MFISEKESEGEDIGSEDEESEEEPEDESEDAGSDDGSRALFFSVPFRILLSAYSHLAAHKFTKTKETLRYSMIKIPVRFSLKLITPAPNYYF